MKSIIVFVSLLLFATTTNAQQYEWVKGGGSTRTFSASRSFEQVTAVCTDDNRNVYCVAQLGDFSIQADTFVKSIAENFSGTVPNKTLLFFSYDCNGTMRFARFFEADGESDGLGLQYSGGKIYLAGSMLGDKKIIADVPLFSDHQIPFLAKFDTSGTMDWLRFVGADNYNTYVGTAFLSMYAGLAIDGNNNIHRISYMRPGVELSGTYTTAQNGVYDLKYDASGNLIGVSRLQLADTNFHINKAYIDPMTNHLYTLLERSPNPPLYNYNSAIAAFSSNGSLLWMDTTGHRGAVTGFRLKGNELFVVGNGSNTNNPFSFGGLSVQNTTYPGKGFATITKLDLNGNAKWIYKLDGSTSVTGFSDIEVLPNHHLAIVGLFAGNVVYGGASITPPGGVGVNPLVLTIDTAGNLIKLDQLLGSGQNNAAFAVTSDKVGNIYIGGQFQSNITATGLPNHTTHGGNTDFFVMKYGRDCSCTSLPSAAFSFVVNAQNRSASFSFTGTSPADSVVWDFGDGSSSRQQNPMHVFPQHGNYTVCATVYTPCGSNKTCQSVSIPVSVQDIATFQNIRIYPNPTTAQLQIEGLNTHAAYEIYNTLGTALQNGQLEPGLNTISTQTLPAGIYLLQVQSNGGEKQVYRVNKQ